MRCASKKPDRSSASCRASGGLVAALGFLLALGTEYATEAWSGDASYYQTHGWPLASVLLTAGAASFIGSHLHRRGSRVVIDKATGREETVGGEDTFSSYPSASGDRSSPRSPSARCISAAPDADRRRLAAVTELRWDQVNLAEAREGIEVERRIG
jgi:hypothetical protein